MKGHKLQVIGETSRGEGRYFELSDGHTSTFVEEEVLDASWSGSLMRFCFQPNIRHALRCLQVSFSDRVRWLRVLNDGPCEPGSRWGQKVGVSGGERELWVPVEIMEGSWPGRMLLCGSRFHQGYLRYFLTDLCLVFSCSRIRRHQSRP